MPTLVSPLDERSREAQPAAPRLDTLGGKRPPLLHLSKPQRKEFLDRLQHLLEQRYGVAEIVREIKPTYTKPAPGALLEKLAFVDGVIEALAD